MPQKPETLSVEEFEKRYGKESLPSESLTVEEFNKRYNMQLSSEQPQEPTPEQPKESIFTRARRKIYDVRQGAISGTMSSLLGVSKILGAVPPETTLEDIGFAPQNRTQELAMQGEQIAEFFIPGGAVSKGAKAVEAATAGKRFADIVRLGARAGLEAGSAAAVTAAQTGGDLDDTTRSAVIAGAIPVIGPTVLKAGGKVGEAIETMLVKPTQADKAAGFVSGNVFKYRLGGTLKQTAAKAHDKINALVGELRQELSNSGIKLDVLDILADTEKELAKDQLKTVGLNSKIGGAVKFWQDELERIAPNGVLDLADTNEVKRSVGKFGSWLYGARDPEASALEKVSNAFYSKLRTAIEKASPTGKAAQINEKLREIIPIETAVLRRMSVQERQGLIGVVDAITGVASLSNPAALWIFAINRLARSGTAANMMTGVAKRPTSMSAGAARVSAGAARVAAGGLSQDQDK